jgi:inositol phosphorylceramide mannosyltransferase catalytic subunit
MYYTILFIVIVLIILLFIIHKLFIIQKDVSEINTNLENSYPEPSPSIENENYNIPKIIIQTWKSNSIPNRYIPLIDSIKQHNPDYQYLFFTDNAIEHFLKINYPQYYQTYLHLPIKIQKIDFFRYVAVYHYGGFYMDLDMSCLKSFDDLLRYDCIFPVDEFISEYMCKFPRYKNICDKGQYFLLGQYAFASSPKHPFIKKIIDIIHKNIQRYVKHVIYNNDDYVYKTTGPDFVTNVYIDYLDKKHIFILNNGKRQYFGDYAQHNYFGTWK